MIDPVDTNEEVSVEIVEIEEPIYQRGGDPNDPGQPGGGDCDS